MTMLVAILHCALFVTVSAFGYGMGLQGDQMAQAFYHPNYNNLPCLSAMQHKNRERIINKAFSHNFLFFNRGT